MRKHDAKKLRLDRETLAPLQADALDRIAGGGTRDIIDWLSRNVCPTNTCAGICSIAGPCTR